MIPIEHLHPMVLHFPIVLAVLLLGADAVALWRGVPLSGRGTYAVASAALAALAGLTAAATAMLGDAAAEIAVSRGVPDALIESHETMGSATTVLLVAWAVARAYFWWRDVELVDRRRFGVVGADAVICAMVLATGYLGGELVYGHGVNVMAAVG